MEQLNDKEKSILPELISAIVKVPSNKQEFILGYAQGIIDAKELKEKE